MTAILSYSKRKILLQIDAKQFERLFDIGGFYDPKFIKYIKKSDREIEKGKAKKRRNLMSILKG
jgi:hypothetical protein